MKRLISISAVLATMSAAAIAQTFNPQVVITNTYDGKVMEVQKNDLPMAVPDSLSNFDLAFDYAVFSNPYKGSYEFSPYRMNITPEPVLYKGKSFYLNAGAGYSLHPEAQLVFSPDMKGRFKLSVYDDFRGYLGNYRYITPVSEGSSYVLGEDASRAFSGRDLTNRFGISGISEGKKSVFSFDASYGLLSAADSIVSRMANMADVRVGLESKPGRPFSFKGDVRFGYLAEKAFQLPQNEMDLGISFMAGAKMGRYARLQAGVDLNFINHKGSINTSASVTSINPEFVWNKGRASVVLGARLNLGMKNNGPADTALNYSNGVRLLTPDVKLSFDIVPGGLTLYAKADGGAGINSYRSLMERYHVIDPSVTTTRNSYLNYSSTVIDAAAGFRGCIGGRLQYDLSAGYGKYADAVMDGILRVNASDAYRLAIFYSDYDSFHADANLLWKHGRFEADIFFRYQKMTLPSNELPVFCLPEFCGNVRARYNLNDSISFGVAADGQFVRKGRSSDGFQVSPEEYRVPGFINLEVFGEYRFSSKISFWVKGSNLLNNNIQTTLLYSQKGVYATAGVCLNF